MIYIHCGVGIIKMTILWRGLAFYFLYIEVKCLLVNKVYYILEYVGDLGLK